MLVHKLTAAEVSTASLTLTLAFDRDPFARWLIPDETARRAGMGAMFEDLIPRRLAEGATVLATEDVSAVAIWLPPGLRATASAPPDARPAVIAAFAEINAAWPSQPHWYLEFVGAVASGRGHGSSVLTAMLEQTDVDQVPSALWTGAEQNLRFYGKHGYRELSRHDFNGASAWWCWREATT